MKNLIGSVEKLTELVASLFLLAKHLTELVKQSRKLVFALCFLVGCMKHLWTILSW